MLQISKRIYFDSAHRNVQKGGKYARLHGHTFFVEVMAQGKIDENYGWIVDFSEIKKYLTPIITILDHSYLNDIPELKDDATVSAVRRWVIQQIPQKPWWFKDIQIGIVGDLCFNPRFYPATESLPELCVFSFESAQALPQLPEQHPCHNLHGHSYFVKVHSDKMAMLPDSLKQIYDILDHRWLNEIEGLEKATSEILTLWIVEKLKQLGHNPDVVIIQETPSSFCLWKEEI